MLALARYGFIPVEVDRAAEEADGQQTSNIVQSNDYGGSSRSSKKPWSSEYLDIEQQNG